MNTFEWNENIPVTANNLNEMQNIINGNIVDKYSTEETITNKIWIDNKPIYKIVFVINSLPNTTTQSIDISNLNIHSITSINGYTNTGLAFNGTRTPTTSQIDLYADIYRGKIDLTTYQDRSNLSGYIILEYTKI